jgi:hypothetical protein
VTAERPHFTDVFLNSLPAAKPGKRAVHWDGAEPGFGIRIGDSGVKTFIAQKRLDGRPVMVTLGRFNGRNLKAARKAYDAAVEKIGNGSHPTHEKRAAISNTLGEVAEAFLVAKKNRRRITEVEGYLRRDWLGQEPERTRITKFGKAHWQTTWHDGRKPYLRDKPVGRIERADILRRVDEVGRERGLFAARHALKAIRGCLNWAYRRGTYGLRYSAAAGLVDADAGVDGGMMRRERVFNDRELRAIWQATDPRAGKATSQTYRALVRILLLSGQRLADWAEATRKELAADDDLLVIPSGRYKTASGHEVPLTPVVIELVTRLPRFENCDWLFSLDGRHAFQNFSTEKARLDAACGVENWQHHDLRRTVRTRLSDLQIEDLTCERVIGHAVGGVREVYDRSRHRVAKRTALEAWEAELLRIVAEPPSRGGKVVPLRKRRAA